MTVIKVFGEQGSCRRITLVDGATAASGEAILGVVQQAAMGITQTPFSVPGDLILSYWDADRDHVLIETGKDLAQAIREAGSTPLRIHARTREPRCGGRRQGAWWLGALTVAYLLASGLAPIACFAMQMLLCLSIWRLAFGGSLCYLLGSGIPSGGRLCHFLGSCLPRDSRQRISGGCHIPDPKPSEVTPKSSSDASGETSCDPNHAPVVSGGSSIICKADKAGTRDDGSDVQAKVEFLRETLGFDIPDAVARTMITGCAGDTALIVRALVANGKAHSTTNQPEQSET